MPRCSRYQRACRVPPELFPCHGDTPCTPVQSPSRCFEPRVFRISPAAPSWIKLRTPQLYQVLWVLVAIEVFTAHSSEHSVTAAHGPRANIATIHPPGRIHRRQGPNCEPSPRDPSVMLGHPLRSKGTPASSTWNGLGPFRPIKTSHDEQNGFGTNHRTGPRSARDRRRG